jgi:formylglycine-generating enzyme required for sulfatase activity
MAGNVMQGVEDCSGGSYDEAPIDGSAWTGGACSSRVVRGASWLSLPQDLRSANRSSFTTDFRNFFLGFRVGRTLTP